MIRVVYKLLDQCGMQVDKLSCPGAAVGVRFHLETPESAGRTKTGDPLQLLHYFPKNPAVAAAVFQRLPLKVQQHTHPGENIDILSCPSLVAAATLLYC